MADDVLSTILAIRLDAAAAQNAKANIAQIKNGLVDLNATANQSSAAATTLTAKLSEISRANQIEKLGRDFGTLAGEIDDVDDATAQLAKNLEDIGASVPEIEAAAKAFADVQASASGAASSAGSLGGLQGLRRTGSALNQLGLGAIGQPVQIAGDIGQVVKEFQQLSTVIPGVTAVASALTPVLGATAAGFAAALAPIALVAVALAPLIIALKVLSDRAAKAAEDAKALADIYAGQADAFAVGQEAVLHQNEETKKSAIDLFNTINDNFRINAEKIQFLEDKKKTADADTAAALQKQIDAAVDENVKLAGSIDILKGNLGTLKVGIDGTADGLMHVGDGTKNFFTNIQNIVGSIGKLGEAAKTKLQPFIDQLQKSAEEAKKRADAEVKINDKLNSDLASIEQKGADNRKAINAKLADDLVAIAQKSADNAQAILDNLQKQEAEAALKLAREDATAKEKADFDALQNQIKFQRTEVAETQKHLNDLKRIREQANEQEFEQGLDRDFAGISKTKRSAAQQINAANEQYDQERAARLQAYKDKQDDDMRQYLFEHQQRVEAEQQQIADAKKAADAALRQNVIDTNKARQAAQLAASKSYTDLETSLVAERNLKIAAAKADLELIVQTEQAKQAAYAASLAQAQAVLNGATPGGSSQVRVVQGHVVGRAGGGSLTAGQLATVNEPGSSGNEGFTAGGKSIRFPGSGLFIPFKSGTVDRNSNGGMNVSMSVTNNITAGSAKDAQKIADVVDKRIEQTVRRIFQVKATA